MVLHRSIAIAALSAAITAAVSGTALGLDARCAALDEAAVGRLQRTLERSDARSTLTANAAMANLGWARLDCREGRVERGLVAYQQVIEILAGPDASPRRASEPAVRQTLRERP
jgi:hypothetical protein